MIRTGGVLFRRLPRPSTIHPVGTRMPKEHTTSRLFRRWTKLLPGWISCRQPLYPHRPVEAVVLALGGRCRRARMRTHPATRYQTPHRLRELNLRNERTSEPLRTLLSPLPIGPQFHTSLQRIRSTSGKNRPLPSPMNPLYTHTHTCTITSYHLCESSTRCKFRRYCTLPWIES